MNNIKIASCIVLITLSFSRYSVASAFQKPSNAVMSFIEWCKQKDSVSVEARKTISALQREINTTDCQLGDSRLKKITTLTLSRSDVTESARIPSYEITDLRPISSLNNLTKLDIDNNKISDLTPLSNLSNLTFLSFGKNQVSDIKHLKNLKNLTELHFHSNKVSDLSYLSELKKLTVVYAGNNLISDITILAGFNSLTKLDIVNSNLKCNA